MALKQIGPYRLITLLGSGRTAEVHCAKHRITKELVAIKLLHEFLTDQHMKQAFLTEAEVVQRLSHPGIVQVLDADFYKQTRPYIVMTYAPGNTLRRKHPRGIVLPFQTILLYTKQIASALSYAHQMNIIHCDVKPENILLRKDNHLLLSDFGIARIRETTLSQTTRDAFGTATYMAPEQFRGKYSPKTDQYALATMVYEWLCGHPPFSGENYNQLMDHHMNMPVPSLREACEESNDRREIPLAVEHVLLKALAKDADERFATIEGFIQELEQAFPLDTMLDNAISSIENSASAVKGHFGPFRMASPQTQFNEIFSQRRYSAYYQRISRRAIVGGAAGLIGTGILGTIVWQSRQWFMPSSSTPTPPSFAPSKTPSPQGTLPVSNNLSSTPLGLDPNTQTLILIINDLNGFLSNSPQAIADIKQQVRKHPMFKDRSVAIAIVYGGTPSAEGIAQAIQVSEKMTSLLKDLGKVWSVFERASYYRPLYMLGSPAEEVNIDITFFAK